MGLYQLAQTLGTPVYELKRNMPISEYQGWIEFFARIEKEREIESKLGGKKNLLNNPNDLVQGLTR
jgi:hypothetical protein